MNEGEADLTEKPKNLSFDDNSSFGLLIQPNCMCMCVCEAWGFPSQALGENHSIIFLLNFVLTLSRLISLVMSTHHTTFLPLIVFLQNKNVQRSFSLSGTVLFQSLGPFLFVLHLGHVNVIIP